MKKRTYKIREFGETVRLLPEEYRTLPEAEKAYAEMGGLARRPRMQIVRADGGQIPIVWIRK